MYYWGRDRRLTAVMLLLVVVSLFNTANSYASHDDACSSEWHVTGYFTPVESDYLQTDKTKINIERL